MVDRENGVAGAVKGRIWFRRPELMLNDYEFLVGVRVSQTGSKVWISRLADGVKAASE